MCDGQILDGHGTGNKAKVDKDGKLTVLSTSVSHLAHHATDDKNAFFVPFSTTLAGTSATPVALLRNTGDKDIEIYRIKISSDAAIEYAIKKGELYTSGGAAVEPTNTNFGSTKQMTAQIYEGSAGDLVTDTTNSKELMSNFISASSTEHINVEGAIIIPPSHCIVVYATGAISDKVRVTLMLSLNEEGTVY